MLIEESAAEPRVVVVRYERQLAVSVVVLTDRFAAVTAAAAVVVVEVVE